jgi:hypothetical protein
MRNGRESFTPKIFTEDARFLQRAFNTTEINYTFRRFPTESILTEWASPNSRNSSSPHHFRKLRDCEARMRNFADVSQALGKLGVLFNWTRPFVVISHCCAFPRHPATDFSVPLNFVASWFSDDVFAALRAANCAFCVGDSEKIHPPIVLTAKRVFAR